MIHTLDRPYDFTIALGWRKAPLPVALLVELANTGLQDMPTPAVSFVPKDAPTKLIPLEPVRRRERIPMGERQHFLLADEFSRAAVGSDNYELEIAFEGNGHVKVHGPFSGEFFDTIRQAN